MDNLHTLHTLIHRLDATPERPCILALHKDGITQWTYGEVAVHVRRLAGGLRSAGLQKGDSVLLLAANRPEWVVACLAVLRAGGVIVPLDTQMPVETLGRVLPDSAARFVFTTTDYLNRLQSIEIDTPPRCILFDVEPGDERGWQALLADENGDLPDVVPDDPATLFYTSGTTGVPKGVPLTHANLAFQLNAILATRVVHNDDRVMLPLPMYHVYPFTVGMLAPLAFGVPMVLPQSLTGPAIVRAVQEGEVSVIIGVPRLYRALYSGIESQVQSGGMAARLLFGRLLRLSIWLRRRFGWQVGKTFFGTLHKRFGKLRLVASGGSALDADLAWKLEGLGWRVAIGYGLTETAPLLTLNVPGQIKLEPASVGPALEGIELRIDTAVPTEGDEEPPQQRSNGPHQEGEILARGPSVFAGYRNLPDQTAESFTDDGWFRTGDLGHFDNDGYLYIGGRSSTLIVTEGGKNIQPEPVEEIYQGHTFIQEIGLLQSDNQLVALIVPEMDEINRQRNGDVDAAIREAVREQSQKVPSYQRIIDYAVTPEPLPKTNLGKIRRHILVEQYEKAKQGIVDTGAAEVGPLPLEDMAEKDRALLQNPAAREVWEWLAARYADRRLTPDTSPQLDLGIDSLSWLNLTLDISDRTGVELSDEAIKRISTVRDLLHEVNEAAESDTPSISRAMIENPADELSDEQKEWLKPAGPVYHVLGIIVFVLLRGAARLFFGLKVRGAEHLPDHGPFVLTPNHTSYFDAPSVAASLNYHQMSQIYWAGSVDVMFKHPIMRFISRLSQTVPVAGEDTTTGRSSLAFAAITLQQGNNLVWFPEGRISTTGEMLPFRKGLGLVLDRYQVPVVPVYIEGASDALPPGRKLPRFKPITVTFGEPAYPRELAEQGEGEQPSERMMQALHQRVRAIAEQEAASDKGEAVRD